MRTGFALLSAAVLSVAFGASSTSAQTFVTYACDDGTPVVAAFFAGERSVRLQLDGKALALPQRLSADGGRYAKSGVSFWIKGQGATLKRPKKKPTLCKAQS